MAIDWDEEDNILAFCCVGPAIIFYGTFVMMFLVGVIKLLLGE